MALIKSGSLFDFSVQVKPHIGQEMTMLKGINNFRELNEISRKSKPVSFTIEESPEERGLALKSIMLNENFSNFLSNYPKNNLYLFSIAWDLSDKPINQFPDQLSGQSDSLLRISPEKIVEFPKTGFPLFSKRKVLGGIAFEIFIMESEKEICDLGKLFTTVRDTILRSQLSYLLSYISKTSGVNGATILLLSESQKRLSSTICNILKAYSDDFVDYLEGYYPISNWVRDFETIENSTSANPPSR